MKICEVATEFKSGMGPLHQLKQAMPPIPVMVVPRPISVKEMLSPEPLLGLMKAVT